jgi:3-oxoacyl-[acyl-carrier protein] reductase
MAPERGTALVTGAGRGIGLAIAEGLWRAGFKVAMASLETTSAAQSREMLQDTRCRYYSFDLADIGQHQGLLDRLEGELGPISCLVNNAGITSLVRGDMLELTPESFDRSVAVNLRGTFFLTQAVARRFVESDSSGTYRSILTISSANAELVGENRADYCITKSSLSMMTKLFAARLAQHGVIASGGVPMRRWGLPDDVAQASVTLATGGLPFATGMHVDIGGGLQLHRLQV